jgi:dihydroceramidase
MTAPRAASCMPDSCFCEAVRTTGIRQPSNSASSLAFVLVAVLVLVRGSNKTIATLFALTFAFVGIGSAYYHATLTFTGQFFDVLGMYLVATLALVMSIDKIRRLSTAAMIGLFLLMNAALAIVLYTAPAWRRWIFGALLVGIIWAELKDRDSRKPYLTRAIVVMTVAFIIWIIDFARIACAPMSFVQGHATWHILGALAAWFLYLHYDHVTRIRK